MLIEILRNKKDTLVNKWFTKIIETYPDESFRFISRTDDQFGNPIGFIINNSLNTIYEEFINGEVTDKLKTALNDIVRIRAVQILNPSSAISFVTLMKDVIRNEYSQNISIKEILEIESRVDAISLISFDLYMQSREMMYEIKANEVKNRFSKMIDRLNNKYDSIVEDV